MGPRTQYSPIPRERTGASQVGENSSSSSMTLVTVIPYLNVMQMLAPRISADAGIRSWEMVEESKPTCQEEPLPCHRFPPSAQILPHYHAVLPHHTMPELTRSYHTTILLLLLPHHARVESDLVAVASSGQEQPRPNASIHHPQPFPDWDHQMLSVKNKLHICMFPWILGEILQTLPQNQILSALATKPVQ